MLQQLNNQVTDGPNQQQACLLPITAYITAHPDTSHLHKLPHYQKLSTVPNHSLVNVPTAQANVCMTSHTIASLVSFALKSFVNVVSENSNSVTFLV